MGKYQTGINGDFSGKIGPTVGSSWNGIGYMKSRPRRVKGRKIADNVAAQRERFKFAADFIKSIQSLVSVGYPAFKNQMTARNSAVSSLLQQAVVGNFGELRIEFSKLIVSNGGVSMPYVPTANSTQPGRIDFSWKDNTNYGNAKADDLALLVAYSESLKMVFFIVSDAKRQAAAASLDVQLFSGTQVHTWMGFLNAAKKDASPSQYIGVVTVA